MTPHRLTNLTLAILMATVLASSYLLDGPSLGQSEADTAADLQAAQAQARAAASCGGDITHCLPAHQQHAKRHAAQQVAAK